MATTNPLWDSILFDQGMFGGIADIAGFIEPREVGQGLLYPALRKAGVTLGPGRTPSPAQFQDSIDELNRLAGSLNCDRLFIYSITRGQYPLSDKTTYTIGLSSDADFVAPRPQLIESANIVSGQNSGWPLEVIADPVGAGISVSAPSTGGIYNDRGYPVSTLYLTGVPQAGESLELFTWTQVPYFQKITDQVLLPMQYEDALVLNLACRLAPHFQRVVDADVRQQARESLMHLRSINAPQPIADIGSVGSCGCGGYDIRTDR